VSKPYLTLIICTVILFLLPIQENGTGAVLATSPPRIVHNFVLGVQSQPKILKTGTILISFSEEDSNILSELQFRIDGKPHTKIFQKSKNQIELQKVPTGIHYLDITHPLRSAEFIDIEIQAGEQFLVPNLRLKRLEVVLSIESKIGAQIYVDNLLLGEITTNGRSNRIELEPGRHTIRVQKDNFEPHSTTQDFRAGQINLKVSLTPILYCEPFLDGFLEGLKFWNAPETWRLDRGKLRVEGTGVGLLRKRPCKDFAFSFRFRLLNGKGLTWVIRAQDPLNHYMFQLVGPKTAEGLPAMLKTYKVQQGKGELLLPPQPIPADLSKPGNWFTIFAHAEGSTITHKLAVPDPRHPEPQLISKIEDRNNPILVGTVGFTSRTNEEYMISSPHVRPLE